MTLEPLEKLKLVKDILDIYYIKTETDSETRSLFNLVKAIMDS